MTQVHLANKWQSWNSNPCMVPMSDEKLWECMKEVNLPCQSSYLDIWAHSGRSKQTFQPNYIFSLGSIISQFSSVQSLSRVRLFATPWVTACQASLSIINSQSSLRLTSIESMMPSSHLILCCSLPLLPPIPPSIRVFSSESTLHIR